MRRSTRQLCHDGVGAARAASGQARLADPLWTRRGAGEGRHPHGRHRSGEVRGARRARHRRRTREHSAAAAHNIATALVSQTFTAAVAIGQPDRDGVRRAVVAGFTITMAILSVICAIIVLGNVVPPFTGDPEVLALVAGLLALIVLVLRRTGDRRLRRAGTDRAVGRSGRREPDGRGGAGTRVPEGEQRGHDGRGPNAARSASTSAGLSSSSIANARVYSRRMRS
ncbi:hypothetical protein FXN61_41725 [Lentzea sp. PSKA42]|uniref:Uncharacterized protein n=1 Tax=Lentzea indica TaxID=2604800 RepID=A0ABX1FV53_9PSEU|nr:hypothetical protein [Lentzea indica]NKE62897.1 hypothetical protein [Lentzea indica]